MDEEPLEQPLADAIAGLEGEAEAPFDLEERVVRALRADGLLAPRGWAVRRRSIVVAAIAVGVGLIGFAAGRRVPEVAANQDADGRSAFLLLLHEDSSYRAAADGAARQARVREYSDWARSLSRRGALTTGGELADEGSLLGGTTRGALSREDRIAGYFMLRARDASEALDLAAGCPALRYGGRVEVRRVRP